MGSTPVTRNHGSDSQGVTVRRPTIGLVILIIVLCLLGRSAAEDPASTLRQADAAFANRKYDIARSLYEHAIREGVELQSDLPHARNLATAYLNSNPPDLGKGIEWLQTVVRLDPEADGIRLQLCKLLLHSGDMSGAIGNYRHLAEAHPQTPEYVIGLASALRQDGKTDAALSLLKESVEQYPNITAIRVEYARVLNFNGRQVESRQQFSTVLAADPDNIIAQVGIAKSLSYQGDQEAALQLYEKVLRSHPGLYDALIGKAFALLWSGRAAEARTILQQGLMRHPDDSEVRDALASLPSTGGAAQPSAPNLPPPSPRRNPERPRQAVSQSSRKSTSPVAATATPSSLVSDQEHTLPRSEPRAGILLALLAAAALSLALAAKIWRTLRKSDRQGTAVSKQVPREETVADNLPHTAAGAIIFAGLHRGMSNESSSDAATQAPLATDCASDCDVANHPAALPHTLDAEPLTLQQNGPGADLPEVPMQPIVREVLIVGGVASVVQLQCRWLTSQLPELQAVIEPNWAAAMSRIAMAPPALVVLNAFSVDRWSGVRMFEWIAANDAKLRRRSIVVTAADQIPNDSEDLFIAEPVDGREWRLKVASALIAFKSQPNVQTVMRQPSAQTFANSEITPQ